MRRFVDALEVVGIMMQALTGHAAPSVDSLEGQDCAAIMWDVAPIWSRLR